MKLSVSLPDSDVKVLDEYVSQHPGESRSSALHAAVLALRDRSLIVEYADAYDEWEASGDAVAWDRTVGDGLAPERALSAPAADAGEGDDE